ncbi:hypothetical protein WA158_003810 [Blastocystis sp. Blastoise]
MSVVGKKMGYGLFNSIYYGLKERGFRGVMKQLCSMGEIKLGTLKGVDEHGNAYYENLDYQYGRHRWIEYGSWNWKFDTSQIPPLWFGWLTSMYDQTPDEMPAFIAQRTKEVLEATHCEPSDCPYNTNVGGVIIPHEENHTGQKFRGYKTWGWKEEQPYELNYLPPGHPLNPERTIHKDKVDVWTPEQEKKLE